MKLYRTLAVTSITLGLAGLVGCDEESKNGSDPSSPASGPKFPIVAMGDLDGDRISDLIYLNSDEIIYFRRGNNSGGYGETVYEPSINPKLEMKDIKSLFVGDFNLDGIMDIAYRGFNNDSYTHIGLGNSIFEDIL